MSRTNKYEAMTDYLAQCPQIANKDFFVNFSESNNGDTVLATSTAEEVVNAYLDGSKLKWFDFTIIQYLPLTTEPNEDANADNIDLLQQIIEWIEAQEALENYPNFGDDCEIEEISTLQNTPTVAGQDQFIAKYMVSCRIEYLERK